MNLPDEWTWGILDGDAGVEGAAILNVSRAVLKKLAEDAHKQNSTDTTLIG